MRSNLAWRALLILYCGQNTVPFEPMCAKRAPGRLPLT